MNEVSLSPLSFDPIYQYRLWGGRRLANLVSAPLRLRVENQLGYKMVKWIERIEFVQTEKTLGKGEGGNNEDDEYFDILPNI